jgi:hypothetical protein
MGTAFQLMNDKKLSEILHARFLNDQLGVIPEGDWDEDGEAPDLIIGVRARMIGLEVTEWHDDHRMMARESEQETILAAARTIHYDRGGVPLFVRIYWNAFDRFDKSSRNRLACELADSVARYAPQQEGGRSILNTADDEDVRLPAEIDRIDIFRYDEDPDTDWMSVRHRVLPIIASADVASMIRRKDRLLLQFRRTDEVWLLLVLGGRHTSSWGELSQDALLARYSTGFHRIFVVSYAPRFASELQVEPISPPI